MAGTESDHEMENDTPTMRGSVVPYRLPASAIHPGSGKRPRDFDNGPTAKRRKDLAEIIEVKREVEEIDVSCVTKSTSAPGATRRSEVRSDSLSADSTSTGAANAAQAFIAPLDQGDNDPEIALRACTPAMRTS